MAWSKQTKPVPDEVRARISATLKGRGSLYKHGMARTPFYRKWEAAKKRCDNPNDPRYKDYGGRGIKMCWRTFEAYRDDMYDSYQRHVDTYGLLDTTLNRKNNDGYYCTENCEWSTRKEQQRNMRSNATYALAEIIEATGLSDSLVRTRLRRGASLAEAIRPSWYCSNCEGKGYASYRSADSGHGTDGAIGGFEGRYYRPWEEMRFCSCERGKQLAQFSQPT